MKDGLQASNKMNSLARSNASLYGNKDDLYDRLRRHAYQGKKSGKILESSNFDDSFNLWQFERIFKFWCFIQSVKIWKNTVGICSPDAQLQETSDYKT